MEPRSTRALLLAGRRIASSECRIRRSAAALTWRPGGSDFGARRAHRGQLAAVLLVPLDGAPQPILEPGASHEPERLPGTNGVEGASRLPVGQGAVPQDGSIKAGQAHDQLDELPNRDLAADAEVDRIGPVVPIGSQGNPLRRVANEQELARRIAGAPYLDFAGPGFPRVDALLDEGRNHVRAARIEVVAWPIQVDRYQVDRVHPVLLPVRLPLHQQHLLGEPVWGVGLFGVSVP